MSPSIYDYIKSEEAKFETDEIQVGQIARDDIRGRSALASC